MVPNGERKERMDFYCIFVLMGRTIQSYKKFKGKMSLAQWRILKKSWKGTVYLTVCVVSWESYTCRVVCSVTWIVCSQHPQKKSRECDLKLLPSCISVIWGHDYFIVFSCKQNSLHKSNSLQLSNFIPLLSLNLLSSRLGPWWCVLCCGIRRGFSWIIYSTVVHYIPDSIWRETFEEGH